MNDAYFLAHPGEDPHVYRRLASDPPSPASAVDPLSGATLLATLEPATSRFKRALRIVGALSGRIFSADSGGLVHGSAPGFGQTEKTVFQFTERSSATIPVNIESSTDVSAAFTFADASVQVTPWTPDATVVRKLPQAVDQNGFSGTTIGIDLSNVPRANPADTLNLNISLLNKNSVTLTWDPSPGNTYTVRTTTDPASGPPGTWPSPPGGIDIESNSGTFTFDNLDFENEPLRLFAVEQKPVP